jgi:hypothetical protein
LGAANAYGKHRDAGFAEPGHRRPNITRAGFTVREQQYRLISALAIVLEGGRCRGEGIGQIGSRIPDIVGTRGGEEPRKGGIVAGERQLKEGAAAEHDQADPMTR